MNYQIPNFLVALPEMIILAVASLTLLAELFFAKRYQLLTYGLTQCGLLLAVFAAISQVGELKVVSFSGHYVLDDVSSLMKVAIYLSVIAAFVYARPYLKDFKLPSGEFYILGLFSTLGMTTLVSANSTLMLYLGLELLSLPLYAMIALRRESGICSEAAIKYFVTGAIASGMLLYGISMLYGATGALELNVIAERISTSWPHAQLMVTFSLVFIVAAVCFKLAAVPFHMWAPDVYSGAPSGVVVFMSAAPKVAALGMLVRFLVVALPDAFLQWQQLLIVASILSVILGNMLAVVQTDIKRLLAYSAISHIGYVLFGLVSGTPSGYSAALFYILMYALMSVAAFGLLVMLSRNGYEVSKVDDLKGLNSRNPWLAFLMLIVMFSMAGVPPTVGFFAKLMVLKSLVDVNMLGVAIVGLLFAVVGAYYYIRIIRVMYFGEPDNNAGKIRLTADQTVVYSVNVLALLALGLFPNALLQLCLTAFS